MFVCVLGKRGKEGRRKKEKKSRKKSMLSHQTFVPLLLVDGLFKFSFESTVSYVRK